jgi:hypothetical protein
MINAPCYLAGVFLSIILVTQTKKACKPTTYKPKCAQGGTRTPTLLPTYAPETHASTNSATWAGSESQNPNIGRIRACLQFKLCGKFDWKTSVEENLPFCKKAPDHMVINYSAGCISRISLRPSRSSCSVNRWSSSLPAK